MTAYKISQVGPIDEWNSLNGVAPGKVFLEEALGAEFIGLSVNSTEPGQSSPLWHTHRAVEEIYVFLEGDGELALDEDVIPVKAGTVVRVGPDVWRALRCLSDSSTPLKWICLRGGGAPLGSLGNEAEIDQERSYPWDN
ncbi:cupin domain-containing protein [Actinomycetaceae bacterium WB03_NA08]|uniref:Cupin domain-containing protein n=1 Tax=Scrofimicrobium canadense TaxID=2652290 RepID=A0A6N7WAD5_9ACTO|nr:cupin domain-containing protein [Scrofimicrobium canadense]MSS85443.1 cupin domain-containing protein [Scrofimicrobium canadense]